jgi:antitoxin (DNA-binding transcriptional repressor) of toxin-antitoxin stability system
MHDILNKSTMEIFTVKEWEERFDELFERVENGERIGIVGDNGHAAVMMPIDDELYQIYVENNQEAS